MTMRGTRKGAVCQVNILQCTLEGVQIVGDEYIRWKSSLSMARPSRVSRERWSHDRAPDCQSKGSGSIPPAVISKFRQFHSPHICLCLSEETLKAGGPFYLVYVRGNKRSHTGGKCVTCIGLTNSRERQL